MPSKKTIERLALERRPHSISAFSSNSLPFALYRSLARLERSPIAFAISARGHVLTTSRSRISARGRVNLYLLFRNQAFAYHMSDCEFGGMRDSGPSTHSNPNEGSIFDARVHFCHSRQRKADLRYKYGILFVANASSFALPLAPVPQISMTQ